ncbi:MAG: NAD(P)-binding protein [Spirochaetota bacterium]
MRRRDICNALWREAFGVLPPATRVIVAGAGPSGLHLASALAAQGLSVTVYEPARCGGVRIPLLHACNLRKAGSALWQTAALFARTWYADDALQPALERHSGPFGEYFSIHTRTYLQLLRRHALAVGVQFVRSPLPAKTDSTVFIATGAAAQSAPPAAWSAALAPLPGWESYFAIGAAGKPVAQELAKSDLRTNYFTHRSRAGFIHLNGTGRAAAKDFAAGLHPGHRHALLHGTRLTTRDRLPLVGFSLPATVTDFAVLRGAVLQGRLGELLHEQPARFFFTGMGYHAMTYSPFLADRVAKWLTGQAAQDEILLGALTPARFLPR